MQSAVLLLAFGGPESLEAIPSFLTRLMGRPPRPEVQEMVTARYAELGGGSPLPRMTREQGRALGARLRERGIPAPVYVGMRYADPGIEEALLAMVQEGIRRVATISLAPYRSQVSTGAYEEAVREIVEQRNLPLEVRFPPDWNHHPQYIAALAEKLEAGLARFPGRRQTVPVLFTAHSLPVRYIAAGDPYAGQIRETISSLESAAGEIRSRFAYQSQGMAQEPWLGPTVEEELDALAAEGETEFLLDPIGFVTDHMETLYDNDILHRRHAQRLGLRFERCDCLNLSPRFIDLLADLATDLLDSAGKGGDG